MTELRLLAPVAVDFYAVPGASLRDPQGYADFWAGQQAAVDDLLRRSAPDPDGPPPVFVLEHTRLVTSLNLYRTISDHAVERPLHVLSGSFQPAHLPEEFAATDPLHLAVTDISFRLYDHGLMLLEVLIDVPSFPDGCDIPARLDELQANGVAMGEQLSREIVRRYLDPVLGLLREADEDARLINAALAEDDPTRTDPGEALWVTRALVISPTEPDVERIVRHWAKDIMLDDDRDPADQLLTGEISHLVRWLNYILMDHEGAGGRMRPGDPFHDQWEALRYAQVYYGVLDRIDDRLSKILADSAATTSRWELERLKGHLLRLSQRAELIIMERRDLTKYLKLAVRKEMTTILAFWDYETLLEQPVRFKIETCDRRLGEFAARRTARATMFTDLILLGIGVTSVLGTALTLAEFGRATASDPQMSVYDLGRSSLMESIAAQPADAILVTSGVISMLLVVLYLYFRRDRNA